MGSSITSTLPLGPSQTRSQRVRSTVVASCDFNKDTPSLKAKALRPMWKIGSSWSLIPVLTACALQSQISTGGRCFRLLDLSGLGGLGQRLLMGKRQSFGLIFRLPSRKFRQTSWVIQMVWDTFFLAAGICLTIVCFCGLGEE